ncbi:kinase-like domain-containing protein [Trichoderma austrokoningii]
MAKEAEIKTNDLLSQFPEFSYQDAVLGKVIYDYYGKRVLEYKSSKGKLLALKIGKPKGLCRSQGEMMSYAAEHGVLAPKVFGTYNIVIERSIARVMVSELVPGVPLVGVWKKMSRNDQASIKNQLRDQIHHMRTLTQPFIGCINRQPVRNIYDTIANSYCGPFDDAETFDEWCVKRLYGGDISKSQKWRERLKQQRDTSSKGFVLTHGDLSPRNIMVQGNKITGIIDWERSGFFPEHVEYATAVGLCGGMEKWWIPVLKEILEPYKCSKEIVKFTGLIEERIGEVRS